ncbi:MAG TPA: fumarylacetoacetate hydrolase family protein, partial [Bordetella sp.]|nr:fumarylacetoacetate hydrolase family protein [Bordetella sp.]
HVTEFMALLPGDILTTGTPDGVALGMDPPAWLRDGDTVEMDITGLGTMRQRIVART